MMKMPLRALSLTGLLTIAACDPVSSVGMRQRLSPPPTVTCLEATLRTSRWVTNVQLFDETVFKRFNVALRDTIPQLGRFPASVELDTRRASSHRLSVRLS